MLRVA